MIGRASHWTQTPSTCPLQPKKWNTCFWIMFNFWWSARLAKGLQSHLSPLSSQKNEMLVFVLCSTSDDQPGLLMNLNPICHPSPAKKMKCSFLDYVQLLMIGRAGQWTRTLSAIPLQTKKWYAHFCITFKFWSLAGLVNGLEPHLQPLSSQKSEMLIFGLRSTSDDWLGWSMDSNPICHLSPGIKWNAHFCITFNLWWSAGLVNGLKPHLPPLSSQKNEMLIFGLHSTSDDQLGWSMDSNPICHPSPAKTMKCSFLDYVQLLIVGWAGQWTQTPSTTCLQPRNEMLIFELHSTSDDRQGWSMDSNPICHLSPAKKMKCLFLDYVQLLMIGQVGQWTQTPSVTPLQPKKLNACFWIMFNFWWSARLVNGLKPHLQPLSNQKNDMLVFQLCWTSDDWPGWLMDLNPICYPSPAKKMKCLFLDYVQLLMISRAGQSIQTPSTTHLQPKKWNAHFCITFNFWWLARLVIGLEPHPPPVSSQKKWNAHFWIMFNFWWSAGLVDDLESHLPPLSSQKNEMLIFGLLSISGDHPGWSMDLNAIHHPSPAKEWNANFWITFNFWWSVGLVNGLQPHLQPLSNQKNEMLIFVLCSNSGDQPSWSIDSNPICHPSPTKKMKCLFLYYVILLMISRAGRWIQSPSTTPQAKKMKC